MDPAVSAELVHLVQVSADTQMQPSQLAASSPLLFLALQLEGYSKQQGGVGSDQGDQSSCAHGGASSSKQNEHANGVASNGAANGEAAAAGSGSTRSHGQTKNSGSDLVSMETDPAACEVPSLTEQVVASQAWVHMAKWAVEMCAVALNVVTQP